MHARMEHIWDELVLMWIVVWMDRGPRDQLRSVATVGPLLRSHHRMSFFFQAEDGIRDYKVTGVQTCALPILELHAAAVPGGEIPGVQFGRRRARDLQGPRHPALQPPRRHRRHGDRRLRDGGDRKSVV